jgi:hypothetical protein
MAQTDAFKRLEPSPQWREIILRLEPMNRNFSQLANNDAMRSFRLASESYRNAIKNSGIQDMMHTISNVFSGIDLDAIKNMRNSPFALNGEELLAYAQKFENSIALDDSETIDTEAIQQEVATTSDFNKLKPYTKLFLLFLLFEILLKGILVAG